MVIAHAAISSCPRLVTAVAMEISQDWLIGRRYLNMSEDENEQTITPTSGARFYRKDVAYFTN